MEKIQAMEHNFEFFKKKKIQIFNFLSASCLLILSSLLFQLNFISKSNRVIKAVFSSVRCIVLPDVRLLNCVEKDSAIFKVFLKQK